tara:strand:- start:53178 stop:54326 length:1149 start_codon:yes stop_codon:yes gene_type:complete
VKNNNSILKTFFVLATLNSLAFLFSCGPSSPNIDSIIEDFSNQIEQDVQEDDVGSISIGIFRNGETLYSSAFGIMDRDTSIPAQPNHIYRTGSISKSITAVLMVLLAQDGLVSIEDPVSKFLPEIENLRGGEEHSSTITLKQLASHTSGLIREPDLEGAASGPIAYWEDKVLASIKDTYFQADPGEEYSYSNIGYGILGLALSRAVDTPFMQLVEERIFQPLNMTSSTFVVGDELEPLLTSGYVYREGVINGDTPLHEHSGRGYKVPNGGVYSTVADLAKFSGLMSGEEPQLLSETLRTDIMSIATPESDTEGYGLGFSISQNENGLKWVSHGGSVAGYNAYLLFQPDSQLSIVMLRNYSGGVTNLGGAAREVGDKLLRLMQ